MKTILLASHCPFVLTGLHTAVTTANNLNPLCRRLPDGDLDLTIRTESVDVLVLDAAPDNIIEYRHLLEGKKGLKPKVIIVTSNTSNPWILSLAKIGVFGILDRSTSSLKELEDAIRSVLLGNRYFSVSIEDTIRDTNADQLLRTDFSEKQRMIVYLISQGLKTREIAYHLNKSSRTIDNGRAYLLRVTRCKNSAELVTFFNENNLLMGLSPIHPQDLNRSSTSIVNQEHDRASRPHAKNFDLVEDNQHGVCNLKINL